MLCFFLKHWLWFWFIIIAHNQTILIISTELELIYKYIVIFVYYVSSYQGYFIFYLLFVRTTWCSKLHWPPIFRKLTKTTLQILNITPITLLVFVIQIPPIKIFSGHLIWRKKKFRHELVKFAGFIEINHQGKTIG